MMQSPVGEKERLKKAQEIAKEQQ